MSNKKNIKDYLHYYLKSDLLCRVKRKNDTEYHTGKLCEVTYKSNHGDWACFWFEDVITVTSQTWETSSANHHWFFFGEDSIIPHLRPLSSMTDEEKEIVNSEWGNPVDTYLTDALSEGNKKYVKLLFESFELFHHLLQKGFDLFGLINAGLAIDKTKIDTNEQ